MAGKQYSLDSRMDLVTTLVQSARPADNMPTMRENSTEGLDLHDTGRQKIKDEVTETKPLPFALTYHPRIFVCHVFILLNNSNNL